MRRTAYGQSNGCGCARCWRCALTRDPYLFQTLHLIRTLTLSRWAASTTLIRASFKPSSSIPYPNQAGYLHYSNPYLFDAEGEALVKISICKVDFNLQAIT